MHPTHGDGSTEKDLREFADDGVVRVDDICYRGEGRLRHELVGVDDAHAGELGHPQHHLLVRDAEGILERAG